MSVIEGKKSDKFLAEKIIFAIAIVFIVRLLIVGIFNYCNQEITQYVTSEDGKVRIETISDIKLGMIVLNKSETIDNHFVVNLECENPEEIILLYEINQSAYMMYINGVLRGQNYNDRIMGHSNSIAYKVFEVEKEDFIKKDSRYRAKIEVIKLNNEIIDPIIYIGNHEGIREYLNVRIGYNMVMLVGFTIILLISSFLFYRDRALYMFITLLISIISFLKCITSGEFPVFSQLLGVTANNYFLYNSITNTFNLFLYQWLIYVIYKLKIHKKILYSYLGIYSILTLGYIVFGNPIIYLVIFALADLVIIILAIKGYIGENRYSIVLLITYNIFAGFNIYTILNAINYIKHGNLSTIIFGPQIGSIIYVLGFLLAVIHTYFNKMKDYEKKQVEYERLDLLRGIGHDLKMPIAVIKLNNQMIEKYQMDEEERNEYLKTSIEATNQLHQMTNNINCYLNMNKLPRVNEKTSVRDSFIKLESCYKGLSKENGFLMVVVVEEDYYLPIDSLRFDRMLYNLVDNALKYNRGQGAVRIAYQIKKEITITIEDHGIGMDEESIKSIFTPFYKADESRNKEGFGLGLSVVSGVVNILKGKIAVESEINVGTKIIIKIPK